MDVSYLRPEGRFNLRVAGVLVRNNAVLVCRLDTTPYWFIPGGRVRLNETSEAAAERELWEELGVQARCQRLLWVAESFFTEPQSKEQFHEICFYYLIDPKSFDSLGRELVFSRREEDGTGIHFMWQPLNGVESLQLRPPFARQKLAGLHEGAIQHLVEYN